MPGRVRVGLGEGWGAEGVGAWWSEGSCCAAKPPGGQTRAATQCVSVGESKRETLPGVRVGQDGFFRLAATGQVGLQAPPC